MTDGSHYYSAIATMKTRVRGVNQAGREFKNFIGTAVYKIWSHSKTNRTN